MALYSESKFNGMAEWSKELEMHRPESVSEESYTSYIHKIHEEFKPIELFIQHINYWLTETLAEIEPLIA